MTIETIENIEDDHPERTCQRCGNLNPVWWIDSDRWNLAVPNRSPILCPSCFVVAHEAATGMRAIWELVPHTFKWIEADR